MEIVRGLALGLSMAGYVLVMHKRLHIISWFSPLLAVCGISLLLYIGGLLGALEETAYAVYAGGFMGITYIGTLVVKNKIRLQRPGLAMVCLGIGSIIFLFVVRKQNLLHYDNFSHWALIVKYLLTAGKFPDAADTLVSFKDYPVGSSIFIYYVCFFLGKEEGIMLIAQTLLILSCFSAVFGIAREQRRFFLYSFLAMGCSMLSYLNVAIRINNLLVDFLLPLMAMASITMTFRYKNDPKKAFLCMALVLGFTGIIKNTGLIFAGVAFAFYLWTVWHEKKSLIRYKIGWTVIDVVSVLFPYLLWKYHVNISLGGIESKFRLYSPASVEPDMYGQIFWDFIRAGTDPSGRAIQVFAIGNLLSMSLIFYVKFRVKKQWKLGWTLFFADLMILMYYSGILALYLYAMPEEEALRLAGFERYSSSIMLLFAGILILQATVDIEGSFAVGIDERGSYMAYSSPEAKRSYQYAVLLSLALAVNFLFSEANGLLSIQESYKESLPGKVKNITGDRWYQDGKTDESRYLVVASDKEGQVSDWNVWYVCRYFLYAPNVEVITCLDAENIETVLNKSDYIIVLDTEVVNLDENLPAYKVLRKPGVYKSSEII